MRAAVVETVTGNVLNIIVAAPDDACPYDGAFLVTLDDASPVGIGWAYVDGQFTDPTPASDLPPRRDRI